jgi:peroxiredoxin
MQLSWRRITYGLLLAAGLAWLIFSADHGAAAPEAQTTAPQKGFLAPDFTLQAADGTSITLSQLRGQAVLVNHWASWCGPCREEMPSIEKLSMEYGSRGFVVIGVDSTIQDDPLAVAEFVVEFGLSFPIVLDRGGEVARLYELRVLPTSFFIDRQGVIQSVVVGGPMPESLLREHIEELLK